MSAAVEAGGRGYLEGESGVGRQGRDASADTYEVLAVRYGTALMTTASAYHHFELLGQADRAVALDYYLWVARNSHRTVVVDTGFSRAEGSRRGRRMLIEPVDALARLSIATSEVSHLIITHAHYDHIGNLSGWPDACIVVQDREISFWESGICQAPPIWAFTDASALSSLVAARRAGRVELVDGHAEVVPGITVRLVGGHTPGHQVVIIRCGEGEVVLAGDALHLYEEMSVGLPFNVFCDLPGVYGAYELLKRYAESGAIVVAGHDPGVMRLPGISSIAPYAVALR